MTTIPIKPGTARRLGIRRPVPDLVVELTPDTTRWDLECLGAELACGRLEVGR